MCLSFCRTFASPTSCNTSSPDSTVLLATNASIYQTREPTTSRRDGIKDIGGVERFVVDGVTDTGWAVVLTNDPGYWRRRRKVDAIDTAFRIHEGRTFSDEMAWSRLAGNTVHDTQVRHCPQFQVV
jgi:hypothetical protein